jgi:hypothetical protein
MVRRGLDQALEAVNKAIELSPDERVDLATASTTDAAASEEYLRGRHCMGQFIYHTISRADLESAIALAFLTRYPTPAAAAHLGEKRMAAFCVKHGYSGRRTAAFVDRDRASAE